MKYIDKTGKLWFKCEHISILMRKHYTFRMIGKTFYCAPIKPVSEFERIINKSLDNIQSKINEMSVIVNS